MAHDGLATLLKLAWLEPRALTLSLERSKHGTDVTIYRGDESAMLSTELLAGPFEPLFAAVLEQTVPVPMLCALTTELATKLDDLERLEAASDHVLVAQSIDEVLDACVVGIHEGLEIERCALYARDEAKGAFVCVRTRSREDTAIFDKAARALTIPLARAASLDPSSTIFAPLGQRPPGAFARVAWRNEVLGYVFADGLRDGHADLLERFSRQVAASWQDFRLLQKVESQSRQDPASGLANRRELDGRLTHERSRAQRMKTSLGFLLVGLDAIDGASSDEVKAAEALLKNVGAIFREELRAHDLAGRFDDTRLAVVLPGAGAFEAALVARRLGLAALRKDISLSVGASSFPDDCDHPDDLVSLAMTHLDAATAGGRGRACLSRDGDPIVFAEELDAG